MSPNPYREQMSVAGVLPRFVTPSDVREQKTRLNSFVVALDASVTFCNDIPPALREGWKSFADAWRQYMQSEESWLSSKAEMDQAEAYERDIARWTQVIGQYKCKGSAVPPPPSSMDEEHDDDPSSGGTVKTVAICAAVVAGFLFLKEAVK